METHINTHFADFLEIVVEICDTWDFFYLTKAILIKAKLVTAERKYNVMFQK